MAFYSLFNASGNKEHGKERWERRERRGGGGEQEQEEKEEEEEEEEEEEVENILTLDRSSLFAFLLPVERMVRMVGM